MEWLATLTVLGLLGFASTARAISLTGGPTQALPGGGTCSVSGSLHTAAGATASCTIALPENFADVYFGIANNGTANGNTMDGSGPSGDEILRYSSRSPTSIVYTSSTTINNANGSSTQPVNTRVVLTLTSGTGTTVDAAGNPANNGKGDIGSLFRITSDSFSVHVAVLSNTSPIPDFGESNSHVFDPTHTPTGTYNKTHVTLAYYYKTCSLPVLYRVNAGGGQVAAADDGPSWAADTGFLTAGGENTYTVTNSIDLSDPTVDGVGAPAGLFQTERWDASTGSEMQWAFPVTSGQVVEVRLLLAEIWGGANAVGKRIFSVSVEGSVPPAFEHIDPYALAGKLNRAVVVTYVQTMADDTLNIELLHGTQNPAIQGIEILELE